MPKVKPIEIHLVPSKLMLNKKGFKDLKCNKDNKILLMSNNYFISCPNSEEEEEEESEIDFSPQIKHKNEDIKSTRKNLKFPIKNCKSQKQTLHQLLFSF